MDFLTYLDKEGAGWHPTPVAKVCLNDLCDDPIQKCRPKLGRPKQSMELNAVADFNDHDYSYGF